ncbi:MAG: hemolysin family protein [Fibrobacterota bacterium]
METNPSFLNISIIALLYAIAAFFATIKIMLFKVWHENIHSSGKVSKVFIEKFNDYEKDSESISTSVRIGKAFSFSAFIIFFYCRFLETAAFTTPEHILYFCSLIFISHIIINTIPSAIVTVFPGAFIIPDYFVFKFFSGLLVPLTLISDGIKKLSYTVFGFDKKFEFLSEEEKNRMNNGQVTGEDTLLEHEKDMIHSIFEFGDTSVKEIMIPRIDLHGIPLTSTLNKFLDMIDEYGHSRLPVFDGTIDNIVGVIYAKDLLRYLHSTKDPEKDWDPRRLLRKAYYVPDTKMLDDLLREFLANHIHFTVVVDEYGGTAGIVTLEDIIEEIVGEIKDEYDQEKDLIVKLDEKKFEVDPIISVADFNEELETDIGEEEEGYATLSGLIYHLAGSVPHENQEFKVDEVRLKILEMENQRIIKVLVKIEDKEEEK